MNREKETQYQKELYQMESDLYDIQTMLNKHQQLLNEMEPSAKDGRKKAFMIGMRGGNQQNTSSTQPSQAPLV